MAQFLKEGLIARGFKQREIDPCVFYTEDLILMIYVDDIICYLPKAELIDEFVASIRWPEPQHYVVEDLGDVTSYLELNVTHNKAGTITLTQPHLIDKIIKSAGFEWQAINAVAASGCEVLKKYPNPGLCLLRNFITGPSLVNWTTLLQQPDQTQPLQSINVCASAMILKNLMSKQ